MGIGTENPQAKLDIRGSIRRTGVFYPAFWKEEIISGDPRSGNTFLCELSQNYVMNANNNNPNSMFRWYNALGAPLSSVDISALSPLMVLDSAGNVGIGTASPGTKLDIKGNGAGTQKFNIQDAAGGSYAIDMQGAGVNSRAAFYIGIGSVADEEFMSVPTYGSTKGNVGIGTANPQGKLHVADSAKTGNDVPLRLGSSDANPMELEFQRVGSSYFGIQSAERNVAYRNLVLNPVAGNVGIGTPAPLAKLDVLGDARISGPLYLAYSDNRIEAVSSDFLVHPYLALTAADDYTVLKPSKAGFRVTNYGNTGNPPWYGNNLILENDGDLWIRGTYYPTSDSRVKANQEPLDYGLAEVLRLQPMRFIRVGWTMNSETGEIEIDETTREKEFGLIAQDVYEIMPEAVKKPEDETTEYWGLAYDNLVAVLAKAIQEQQQTIGNQQAEIELLEKRITALEQR